MFFSKVQVMGFLGGLFSSEKVISVSTSVSRVIEDRLIPDSIKTGTIKGILKGDQLVENILEDVASSIGVKAERMYHYGKTGYPWGVPTSQVYRNTDVSTVARAVIDVITGQNVSLDYCHYGSLNRQHYGWQRLCDSYGYNPDTNELASLSAAKGFPVYLDDMQVVIPQSKIASLSAASLEQWGTSATAGYTPLRPYSNGTSYSATPICIDPVATDDYFRVTGIWKDVAGVIQRESFTFPFMVIDAPTDFVQLKYSYQVEAYRTTEYYQDPEYGVWLPKEVIHYATKYGYFTYQVGNGTFPEFDGLFTHNYDSMGSFFPFGYFRYNRTPTSTDKSSAEYKAAHKLMNYLGLDYVQINEAINANPQIGEVESALLMMIVPAVSSDPMENRYLFDFFRGLYAASGAVTASLPKSPSLFSPLLAKLLGNMNCDSSGSSRISLSIRDSRFSTSLGMSRINRKTIAGNIGKVGTYTSSLGSITEIHKGTRIKNPNSPEKPVYEDYTWETTEPCHFYRKQITPHLYEEIQVYNLAMTYEVWGGHTTTNDMVPIDHAITDNYSIPDREHLYARSLHYVINAKHETTVKWYQQGWFGTVILIIAIVWTIWSMGSDGGSSLGAAMAAGEATLMDVVVAVVVAAVEYMVYTEVAKLFVKLFGADFALIAAVVMAAYGLYESFGGMEGVAGAPWAKDMLSLSNSIITQVGESYTKAIQGLKDEEDRFGLFAKTKIDELEKIKEDLEGSHLISPFILWGEAPTDYFNRTVHSGNVGVMSIDAISNYVDSTLTLPKISQTLSFGQPSWG